MKCCPQASDRPGSFGDVSVNLEEWCSCAGWKESVDDHEIDRRITRVHVAPVDDAAEAMIGVNQKVTGVQIAVDYRASRWFLRCTRARKEIQPRLDFLNHSTSVKQVQPLDDQRHTQHEIGAVQLITRQGAARDRDGVEPREKGRDRRRELAPLHWRQVPRTGGFSRNEPVPEKGPREGFSGLTVPLGERNRHGQMCCQPWQNTGLGFE